jgi:hypothetical protein
MRSRSWPPSVWFCPVVNTLAFDPLGVEGQVVRQFALRLLFALFDFRVLDFPSGAASHPGNYSAASGGSESGSFHPFFTSSWSIVFSLASWFSANFRFPAARMALTSWGRSASAIGCSGNCVSRLMRVASLFQRGWSDKNGARRWARSLNSDPGVRMLNG